MEIETVLKKNKSRNVRYLVTAILITGLLVRIFLVDTFIVKGNSMAPTIVDGDYVFVNKTAYINQSPQKMDIVVGEFRNLDGVLVIKRVVGQPREWVYIENGEINVTDKKDGQRQRVAKLDQESFTADISTDYSYRLDPFEYFLIGDNGLTSVDSRELGPVDIYAIKGRVVGFFRLSTWDFTLF